MSMIFPQSVDATKDSDAYNATVRLLVVDVEALFGAASCSIAEASAAPESSQMMQDHPQHRIRRRTTRATLEQMNMMERRPRSHARMAKRSDIISGISL
jgi:hypothetical protein